jgi:hypothetical protein
LSGERGNALLAERGLSSTPSLGALWDGELPDNVAHLVYSPATDGAATDVASVEAMIEESDWPLLPNLVPLLPVDERSVACVVLSNVDEQALPGEGAIVRWHLDVKDERHQAALLDTDCQSYVDSLAAELAAREEGLGRVLDQIGPAYQEVFLANDKRPRDFVVRPVRIACQNVIVALAAFAQDSAFDGLGVVAWQTCEVPHVATHEANRALAALTLCDAFKSGGTMEIRFDRPARVQVGEEFISFEGHPEGRVPASFRRFGRTVGVELGVEDRAAISPSEARALFQAVTPMPAELRERVAHAAAKEGMAPERLCFALMTGTWRPLELDFLLAATARTGSILSGGSDWRDRPARQAESEACRAASMASMLLARLDRHDSAARSADGVRVIEDDRQGVTWRCLPELAAIEFNGIDPEAPLPWCEVGSGHDSLTVFPRTALGPDTLAAVRRLQAETLTALLLPRDSRLEVPDDVLVLRCPDRLADIDKSIEAKLLTSRIARG